MGLEFYHSDIASHCLGGVRGSRSTKWLEAISKPRIGSHKLLILKKLERALKPDAVKEA